MSLKPIRWLAEMAGAPLFRKEPDQPLQINEVASGLIGGSPQTVEEAVATLLNVPADHRRLEALMVQARADGFARATLDGSDQARWHLLCQYEDSELQLVAVRADPQQRKLAEDDLKAAAFHELANALTAIAGWAELATQNPSATSMRKALWVIEKSAKEARCHARSMINPGRAERADEASPGSEEMLAEVQHVLHPQARQRGVGIDVQVARAAAVQAPRSKLLTILWNLTLNALQASPSGARVTLHSTVHQNMVRFVVVDRGSGMNAWQRKRIFDPYFTTKEQGTGLGLPLVKQTVEQLGGRILVESRVGTGTRFVVELPRAKEQRAPQDRLPETSHAPAATFVAEAPPGVAAKRSPQVRHRSGVRAKPQVNDARVLVVEDDEAVRELVQASLELRGAHVTAVSSGQQAKEVQGPFDVALVDMTLCDTRGDRVLRELRSRKIIHAGVIVSGVSEPPDLDPGAAPDSWLRKPFDVADLIEVVSRLRAEHHAAESQTSS